LDTIIEGGIRHTSVKTTGKPTAIRTLLGAAIDYAGLFPPAKLSMEQAVKNYANYRAGVDSWGLGRFVVPCSRLEEFELCAVQYFSGEPWPITALGGSDPAADAHLIRSFNTRLSDSASIDSVELKITALKEIASAADQYKSVSESFEVYIETPAQEDPRVVIGMISGSGVRAKIRTGGITNDLFPPAANVARFMFACAEADVPFKATAGLHHARTGSYALTYENGSASGTMFGFLNLFIAAAIVRTGGTAADAADALGETAFERFKFSNTAIRFETHSFSRAVCSRLRTEFAMSFGSCSFTEPISELKSLKLIE